ncbi:MAG: hypothetical protein R3F65_29305 [bacterium]|nr:hypothetical protein [Myxococcales bacterium]
MSRAHLAAIDRLTGLFDDALAALRAGTAPDLQTLDREIDTHLAALGALGPIDPEGPLAARCHERLTALDAARAQVAAVLGEVRAETGRRLGRVATGRRGIGAYRASFDSGRRGHERGQG